MALTLSSEFGLRLTNFCESMNKEMVSSCISVFRFEAHPRRMILLIVGEVTVTILVPADENSEQQWTEEFKKPIHLLGLSRSSKTEKIVAEIMNNCPFIEDSMISKLCETVEEIKQREYSHNGFVIHRQTAADGSFLPRYPEVFDELDSADISESSKPEEPDYGKLDHYIELMYEEIPQKIEASMYIAQLIKTQSYLYNIAQHESAVNALFRTLREDCKKSIELTKNILCICLAFAKVTEFQKVLIKHKIPQLTLDIIDFELERCEKWKARLISLEESASQDKGSSSKAMTDYHITWIKLDELLTTQNALLKVGFEILHCVSENKGVREILLRQNVISSLVDSLDRKDNELLEIVLSYLQSIACLKQFIHQMVAVEIVDKLANVLKGGSPIPKKVVNASFHILFNLSFHSVLRERIIHCGLIKIMSNCYGKSMFQDIVSKTLYVLSMEPIVRNRMAKPSFIKTLMNYAVSNPDSLVSIVIGSLCVNLSRNKRCADLMWESNQLSQLIKNVLKNEDCVGMKIIRNLAELEAAFLLYERVGDIAAAIVRSTNQLFVAECIGTLAALDASRVDIEVITQNGKIFPWLRQTLGYYLEEAVKAPSEILPGLPLLVIDVILLLGNLCEIEDGARLIVGEGFADLLLKIVHIEKVQSKITLQIINVFKICSKHESISVFFALRTRVPSGILEFAESSEGDVKQLCVSTLEQIGMYEDSWRENMQQFHFLSWNRDWTDAIALENSIENEEEILETAMSNNNYRNPISNVPGSFDNSSDSESRLSSGNESEYVDSNVLDLFRQQFEEEMNLKGLLNDNFLDDDDLFNYDSDFDSGWQNHSLKRF